MSAPEGIALAGCAADLVQLAALRDGAAALAQIANRRGWALPSLGRLTSGPNGLALSVSPERWLLLAAPAPSGTAAAAWRRDCAGCGAVVDLSCALSVLHIAGADTRQLLARGCRLDLEPHAFPQGCAAATLMAQVSVVLAALSSGMLVLTPATTAQHLREWLTLTGKPFRLAPREDVTVAFLQGDQFT